MVKECIDNYMSKDETQIYLQSRYQFARHDISEGSPREGTSATQGEQEQQRLSPPPPPSVRRTLWNSPNVQRYAAQVPQEAANNAKALENQNLQASSPAYPNDFWQQLLNTLDQIQSKIYNLER
ncbi:unnamed protein product [Brassica rapa]|uniref:Uncharacterized protein n=1 Tax=Brassica campestris TaxID=3711 RepID=A0A8D9H8L4_BRACM|nr:unnamed protein product [Brassica rapa]